MYPANAARLAVTAMAILAAFGNPCPAQTTSEFDVVSVKPNASGAGGGSVNTSRGRFEAINVTLHTLVMNAFDVRYDQVTGGPPWFDNERHDVVAKYEVGESGDDRLGARILAMLADRFQLKFHRETKQLPVYSLAVAKGGPKLKERDDALRSQACGGHAETPMTCNGRGAPGMRREDFVGISAVALASRLGRILGRSVIDNTGLTGTYDFSLEWARNPDADPSLFTVLQEQLGLKLENAKGPVEIIVVDSAQHASAN
jgi:uncharacterized protein (TIGR03435 family)